jgi:hypothetical protein
MNREFKHKALTSALITSLLGGVALAVTPNNAFAQQGGAPASQQTPQLPQTPGTPPTSPTDVPPGAPSQPGTPIPTGPVNSNGNTGGATNSPAPALPGERPAAPTVNPAPAVRVDDPALRLSGGNSRSLPVVQSATRVNPAGGSSAMRNATVAYGTAASALMPADVTPILNRAAEMAQRSRYRQRYAPAGAKKSYSNAESALRAALKTARMSTSSSLNNASAWQTSVSSAQAAEDIRTLRETAKSATPQRAAMLRKVASLYATGSKEFFTAQLREALLETDAERIVIRNNGNNGYGRASSASQPAPWPKAPASARNTVGSPPNNSAPPTLDQVAPPPGVPGSGGVAPNVIITPVVPNGVVISPNVIVTPTAPIVPVPVVPVVPTAPPTTIPENPPAPVPQNP